MSIHSSLKVKNKHVRRRNVLSREERIEKLTEDESWADGDSVYGLPKVRVVTHMPRKAAKEKTEETEATEAGEAPQAAMQ